jgi:hypothetical protein
MMLFVPICTPSNDPQHQSRQVVTTILVANRCVSGRRIVNNHSTTRKGSRTDIVWDPIDLAISPVLTGEPILREPTEISRRQTKEKTYRL